MKRCNGALKVKRTTGKLCGPSVSGRPACGATHFKYSEFISMTTRKAACRIQSVNRPTVLSLLIFGLLLIGCTQKVVDLRGSNPGAVPGFGTIRVATDDERTQKKIFGVDNPSASIMGVSNISSPSSSEDPAALSAGSVLVSPGSYKVAVQCSTFGPISASAGGGLQVVVSAGDEYLVECVGRRPVSWRPIIFKRTAGSQQTSP